MIPSLVLGGRAVARGVLASLGGTATARGRVVLAWEGRAGAGEALASPGELMPGQGEL